MGLAVARLGLVLADAGGPGAIAGVTVPAADADDTVPETLMLVLCAGLGALVASRQPRNPVGWLLLTTAVSFGMLLFAERLAWHHLLADRVVGDRVANWLWVANWMWIPAVVPLFIFLPLVFPTGRALSPRWSRLVWVMSPVVAAFVVSSALRPGPLENYTVVANRFGTGPATKVIAEVCFGLCGAGALASVASLALRFRRSHGVERQQIKWMSASGALLVVCFVLSALLEGLVDPDVSEAVLFAGILSVPVAVAVAILRYHLYDVAVVVNRTLVYVSLTAALALVYLAGVLLLQLIPRPVTKDPGWRWPSPRSRSRAFSAPSGDGSRSWWTCASTAVSTTPPARWRRSACGCASSSSSTA